MISLSKFRTLALAGAALVGAAANATWIDQQVEITKAKDNRTLTVRYTGAKAKLAELRINGQSAATRTLSNDKSAGETNFLLETSQLAEGDNNVEIRLYDDAGRVLAVEKTTVYMDRSANGPIFLNKPQQGATVNGFVELSVGFKSEIKSGYVSFFVNNEFKSLKNFEPYTYLWDTNTVTNGWHEVEAWVVDSNSNTFRTQRIRVFVDNPNGRTDRIKDPASTATTVEPREVVATVTPTSAKAPVGSLSANVTKPGLVKSIASKAAPKESGLMMGTRLMRPTGKRVATQKPEIKATVAPKIAVATVPSNPPKTDVKPTMVEVTTGTKLPNIGYYPISINGTKVKFDVMPRVTDGVALTPFRHLFEHVGGEVKWKNEVKTVTAKGVGQDLMFKIGDDFALVNGDRLGFERASFLENGRAIVPLSFVQKLLNVEIQYDPGTKHVLITKAK